MSLHVCYVSTTQCYTHAQGYALRCINTCHTYYYAMLYIRAITLYCAVSTYITHGSLCNTLAQDYALCSINTLLLYIVLLLPHNVSCVVPSQSNTLCCTHTPLQMFHMSTTLSTLTVIIYITESYMYYTRITVYYHYVLYTNNTYYYTTILLQCVIHSHKLYTVLYQHTRKYRANHKFSSLNSFSLSTCTTTLRLFLCSFTR
jgi:hypothetical protein